MLALEYSAYSRPLLCFSLDIEFRVLRRLPTWHHKKRPQKCGLFCGARQL